MRPRLKLFDRPIQACNPYQEFWEFLEWLARRRQYPEPLVVWNAVKNPKQPTYPKPKPIKFPGYQKDVFEFPGADGDSEYRKNYRQR